MTLQDQNKILAASDIAKMSIESAAKFRAHCDLTADVLQRARCGLMTVAEAVATVSG